MGDMADLNVQELLTGTTVELRKVVPGTLSTDLRDRQIAHVIADLSARLLKTAGVNPRGLIVSVTSDASTDYQPDFMVVATAPTYS